MKDWEISFWPTFAKPTLSFRSSVASKTTTLFTSSAASIAFWTRSRAAGETSYTATALSQREGDPDWYARAARALDVARGAFGSANRPYNAMVIPAGGEDELFVYLVPAPRKCGGERVVVRRREAGRV